MSCEGRATATVLRKAYALCSLWVENVVSVLEADREAGRFSDTQGFVLHVNTTSVETLRSGVGDCLMDMVVSVRRYFFTFFLFLFSI
jgi:hypothetical protein